MRGKVNRAPQLVAGDRITPAYAGKSQSCSPACRRGQDHPRVCGEKVIVVTVMLYEPGSPPRMRGKEDDTANKLADYGITPAYAGKSIHALLCVPAA